jgi:hypothetical protein
MTKTKRLHPIWFYDVKIRPSKMSAWKPSGRSHTMDEALVAKKHWKRLCWNAQIIKKKD